MKCDHQGAIMFTKTFKSVKKWRRECSCGWRGHWRESIDLAESSYLRARAKAVGEKENRE